MAAHRRRRSRARPHLGRARIPPTPCRRHDRGRAGQEDPEISQLAGGTFNYFRPFLDDPALPAADSWDRLRSATRDAINTLGLLAAATRKWKDAYPAHANEIIGYINERVLPVGTLFDDLPAIAELGAARYEGRIPPGYQDRNKKGQGDDDPDEVSVAGANRYGDLIFWKESMDTPGRWGPRP